MRKQTTSGFSLIEVLIVVVIVGVLAAIATPSWVAFNNRQRLNTANNQVYQALRQAQSNAKLKKETWQVSFKQVTGQGLNWFVHPSSVSPTSWNKFPDNVQIETGTGTGKTTFDYVSASSTYQILFNYKGCPIKLAGETCTNSSLTFPATPSSTTPSTKIVVSSKNGGVARRCVLVSTRLGAIRNVLDTDCNN
jgi:prepilin-type N-terminal cleavage/methylation domain-containing protein